MEDNYSGDMVPEVDDLEFIIQKTNLLYLSTKYMKIYRKIMPIKTI